jgi:hypothetical protein
VNNKILFHSRIDRDLAQMLLFGHFSGCCKHPRSTTGGQAVARSYRHSRPPRFAAQACRNACLTHPDTPNGGMYIQDRAGTLLTHRLDKWRSVSFAPLSSGLSFGKKRHLGAQPASEQSAACSRKMGPLGICASDRRGGGGSATPQVPGQMGYEASGRAAPPPASPVAGLPWRVCAISAP